MPNFLRRWIAMAKVWNKEEIAGILYDYKNGEWELMCQWNTDEERLAAKNVVDQGVKIWRDVIYVTVIKTEGGAGLFIVEDSNYGYFFCAWHPGVYELRAALEDTAARCRKTADKMGYRRPERQD